MLSPKEWTPEQATNAYRYGICVVCGHPREPLLEQILRPDEWAKIPAGANLTLMCPNCGPQLTRSAITEVAAMREP